MQIQIYLETCSLNLYEVYETSYSGDYYMR